tara:strand:- start:7684 stop:8688 length:1005 start_codon:yes stop_codon:yes gene_type:complete
MIHLLICPHVLDYGGSQISVHHWAKHLDSSKFKITILAMKEGGLSSKFESNYSVYYDDIGYPNVENYIRRFKPDILHACPGGGTHQEYITKAAKLVPVTQTIMCPRLVSNKNDVSGSIVLSNYVFSLQTNIKDVFQIDPPFDITDYNIKHSTEYFGLPKNKLIIGSLGNNRRENAHFMKIVRYYKNKNVHFVIKTNKKYKYLFGRKRITAISGNLSEDEKMSLIKCFDIFLYPTSNESYGMVFLEAMSQKIPIISYDDSAMPEVIEEGGLLAPLNDINKMMELLDDLTTNENKRRSIGQVGYKLFRKRNDPKLIVKKYEKFFEEIFNSRTSHQL